MKVITIVCIVVLSVGVMSAAAWAIWEAVQLNNRKKAAAKKSPKHTKSVCPAGQVLTPAGCVPSGGNGGGGSNGIPCPLGTTQTSTGCVPDTPGGGGYGKKKGHNTPPLQYGPGPAFPPGSPGGSVGGASLYSSGAALDPLGAGRMRSNRSTGYDSDLSNSCMNENLIGAQQAPLSDRAGNMRPSFPSAPMGGKPVPLGSSKISNNSNKHGSLGRTSTVDLSAFARMGMDRAIGAQGLDSPDELALASVMLGHIEAEGNNRTMSTDPRGEAVGGWQVGYARTDTGIVEPGYGGQIPVLGPYQMSQRPTGVIY